MTLASKIYNNLMTPSNQPYHLQPASTLAMQEVMTQSEQQRKTPGHGDARVNIFNVLPVKQLQWDLLAFDNPSPGTTFSLSFRENRYQPKEKRTAGLKIFKSVLNRLTKKKGCGGLFERVQSRQELDGFFRRPHYEERFDCASLLRVFTAEENKSH